MRRVELRWPGWMKRETVAAYTDLSPAAVDQYVKRGLLPKPHPVGEALLWSLEEVDKAIRGDDIAAANPPVADPYLEGIKNAAPPVQGGAAAARALRAGQG